MLLNISDSNRRQNNGSLYNVTVREDRIQNEVKVTVCISSSIDLQLYPFQFYDTVFIHDVLIRLNEHITSTPGMASMIFFNYSNTVSE